MKLTQAERAWVESTDASCVESTCTARECQARREVAKDEKCDVLVEREGAAEAHPSVNRIGVEVGWGVFGVNDDVEPWLIAWFPDRECADIYVGEIEEIWRDRKEPLPGHRAMVMRMAISAAAWGDMFTNEDDAALEAAVRR